MKNYLTYPLFYLLIQTKQLNQCHFLPNYWFTQIGLLGKSLFSNLIYRNLNKFNHDYIVWLNQKLVIVAF